MTDSVSLSSPSSVYRFTLVLLTLVSFPGFASLLHAGAGMDRGRKMEVTSAFALKQDESDAIPPPRPKVVMIFIEGFTDAVVPLEQVPNIAGSLARGSLGVSMEPVEAPGFLPTFTSCLTAVSPQSHGIHWDRYQPGFGVSRARTVFDQLRFQGFESAVVASHRKVQHGIRPGLVQRVSIETAGPVAVVRKAMAILSEPRFRFVLLHVDHPLRASIRFGVGSAGHLQAIREVDQCLGFLLDGAIGKEPTDPSGDPVRSREISVMIVTDPGSRRPPLLIQGLGSMPTLTVVGSRVWGGRTVDRIRPGHIASTALWRLGVPFPAYWRDRPLFKLYDPPVAVQASR